ncbi:MAG: Gfo/Idh/MocA family oxidoreductase [Bacteroidales bacterium]|nr:Gfo/Idh/MocA family oxidoreductase [Bacteroidales bacterium]
MLKIGVIGVGYLGRIHLKCIQAVNDFEIVGFYDISDEGAAKVESEFYIKRYNNYLELIEDSDVVSIITPTASHYEYARAAITRSRHVFIEKPLVNNTKEAEELLKLSEEAEVKVQVGHVERFNPGFLSIKNLINKPMFMEGHRLSNFNNRGLDIPVVYDLMIHDIDIVLSVVNSPIKRIYASGVPIISESPDIANARIEFDNGAVANLTASRISIKKMRKIRFFQQNAYITVDFLNKKSELITLKTNDEEDRQKKFHTISFPGLEDKKINIYQPDIIENNAIQTELKYLYNSIINDTDPVVSINDGYNALSVAQAIMKKIKL